MASRPGLYANIHAKRKRIKAGSKEKMRKRGTKGSPTKKDFRRAAKVPEKESLRKFQRPKKVCQRSMWQVLRIQKQENER